jgi:hypothetical protein
MPQSIGWEFQEQSNSWNITGLHSTTVCRIPGAGPIFGRTGAVPMPHCRRRDRVLFYSAFERGWTGSREENASKQKAGARL